MSLFGADLYVDALTADEWVRSLSRCWIALVGEPPGDLRRDLKKLAPIFGGGVSARGVKERIYALPPAVPSDMDLPTATRIILDGCAVITPEGRILLAVLSNLRATGASRIDQDSQLAALALSSEVRSEWHAAWLQKQFDTPLSPAALGAAVFLLVNGSIGRERAFDLPADESTDRALADLVLPALGEFSSRLGRGVPDDTSGLRKHWTFSQVSRLLGRDVARVKTPDGSSIYVRPGREAHLLEDVSMRLARMADATRRRYAVDGLLTKYRESRGLLAARGLSHEDPTATRRVARSLIGEGPDA